MVIRLHIYLISKLMGNEEWCTRCPSGGAAHQINSSWVSWGVSTAVGSSRIRIFAPRNSALIFHLLLLAHGQVLHPLVRVRKVVFLPISTPRSCKARSTMTPFRLHAQDDVLRNGRGDTSMKCWCTI